MCVTKLCFDQNDENYTICKIGTNSNPWISRDIATLTALINIEIENLHFFITIVMY